MHISKSAWLVLLVVVLACFRESACSIHGTVTNASERMSTVYWLNTQVKPTQEKCG